MSDTQTIMIETIIGPRPILAPATWEFDKTATVAWAKLLELTRESRMPHKSLRDRKVLEGQIYILAIVLANALGMAPPYWSGFAFAIIVKEAS